MRVIDACRRFCVVVATSDSQFTPSDTRVFGVSPADIWPGAARRLIGSACTAGSSVRRNGGFALRAVPFAAALPVALITALHFV